MERGPREITGCLIRRLESRHTTRWAFEVKPRSGVLHSRRRDAVNASSHFVEFAVGHVVAADSSVVPIRDQHRTIGRDTNIARTEPIIRARQKICNGGAVTGSVVFDWIGADHFGTCIAVY